LLAKDYIDLARLPFEAGEYENSLQVFSDGLKKFPNNFQLIHGAARCATHLGLHNLSLIHWSKLFRQSEKTEYLYLKKTKALLKVNLIKDARTTLREGVQLHTNNEHLFPIFIELSRLQGIQLSEDIGFLKSLKNRTKLVNLGLDRTLLILIKVNKDYSQYMEFLESLLIEDNESVNFIDFKFLIQLARNSWLAEVRHIHGLLQLEHVTDPTFLKLYFQLGIELKHLTSLFSSSHHYDITNVSIMCAQNYTAKMLGCFDMLSKFIQLNNGLKMKNLLSILSQYDGFSNSIRETKWLDTQSNVEAIIDIVDWLKDRIVNGTPTSFIRIGDGEACFLPYEETNSVFKRADQDFILNIWWGEKEIGDDVRSSFESNLISSINNADLIGVPPPLRIAKDLQCYLSDGTNRVYRNISGIYKYFEDFAVRNKMFTSAHLHTDLEKYDLYRELFYDLKECTVICCHKGIADKMKEKYAIPIVNELIVPGEDKYVSLWNGESNVDHYPTVFRHIYNQKWVSGNVYLVAAGFLGKLYCSSIKNSGGIAIDIGSIVDYWMGHTTRDTQVRLSLPLGVRFKRYLEKWQLVKDSLSKIGRLNYYSDRELGDSGMFENQIAKQYLITAHPRCGSNYISSLFVSLGLMVGHEVMDEAGISSWQLVAQNSLSLHFQSNSFRSNLLPRNAYHFSKKIHLVRNYLSAVPSILLENENTHSYNFRRAHIYLHFGIDLDDFPSTVERALVSYIYWNKLALSQEIDVVVRLEFIEEDLISYFGSVGNIELCDRLAENKFDKKPVNSSWDKRFKLKPVITKSDYITCNKFISDHLDELNKDLGYETVIQ